MKNSPAKFTFRHSNFFALRSALLPWDEFLSWSDGLESHAAGDDAKSLEAALTSDRQRLRGQLRRQLDRPEVREAVFVASPSLDESLDHWRSDPDSPRGQKAERSLVRYFARMTGRATPFGLFAGCAVGRMGETTSLSIAGRDEYRRHTRLDMEYVLALADALAQHPSLRPHLSFRPNSTMYRAAGQVRYSESRFADGQRTHHLVAVEETEYLLMTLARARGGVRPAELAAALVDDEISLEDASEFIDELIGGQLLVSDLQPSVTGPEPIHALIERLESLPQAADVVERLRQVRDAIDAIDSQPHAAADQYKQIAAALKLLPAKVELPRLFQVDLFKPAPRATLSPAVLEEMQRGVEILSRLVDRENEDSLSRFRKAFVERYEGREAPLVEVLDEEIGIGFERSTSPGAEAAPLLAGLAIPQRYTLTTNWKPRHSVLLEKLMKSRESGSREIELTEADLAQMAAGDPLPIPDAISVMATLAAGSPEAIERGNFRLLFTSASGPSGARMLGRFCHGDELLERHVAEHLRAEEALQPEAIFAEVVHLPEGRVGNVLLRPVLRDYEIPYLGLSGAPAEKQIPVTDLRVSVEGDRIVLRSASLGREIIPRLSNAHNYAWKSLGVYKFLCALQHQGVAGGLMWDWGPLESAEFLPRVTSGRLVLSRARWLVSSTELKALAAARGIELFRAVQKLRDERGLPRYVALRDADNELPVDLENILSIEALVDVLKNRGQATLVEIFPACDELCARGPEGRFVHELVVPLVRRAASEAKQTNLPDTESGWDRAQRAPRNATPGATTCSSSAPATRTVATARRRFGPGSEWLYVKIYTGAAMADRLLRDELRAVVDWAVRSGACDRWFFIRYADPDHHLRVRLHGDPARLCSEIVPRLEKVLAGPLDAGWVSRVQYDTYDRETERYGGDEGVLLAEELFDADSEAALAIVASCSGDEGLDARWRLALRGIDQLLDDLGFDLSRKAGVVRLARENFSREFGVGADFKNQAGQKYRRERASLEALLNRACDHESLLGPGLAALAQRSSRLRGCKEMGTGAAKIGPCDETIDFSDMPVPASSRNRKGVATRLRELAGEGALTQPLEDLAGSYVHMWVNRVLRSAQRAQELVLYDFLDRLYQSAAARTPARKEEFA
jgi:class I lanthipeptide synthase